MEQAPIFSWIHLSDIHFRHQAHAESAKRRLVLEALTKDALKKVREHKWHNPNVILISGDIAWGGKTNEYDEAEKWLSTFANKLDLALGNIFAVPGNHDIDRDTAKLDGEIERIVDGLRKNCKKIDHALNDITQLEALIRRAEAYMRFANKLAPTEHRRFNGAMWWHRLPVPSERKIRLVGLNSSLLALGGKADRGKLAIGDWQIDEGFSSGDIGTDEIVISMSHHPLIEGWLADERSVKGSVTKHAHIHLAGHIHAPDSELIMSAGGAGIIQVAAAAAHEATRSLKEIPRHGYNYSGIYPKTEGGLELRVYPRRYSSKNEDFRMDVENIHDENFGYARFDLPLKNSNAPPLPRLD